MSSRGLSGEDIKKSVVVISDCPDDCRKWV